MRSIAAPLLRDTIIAFKLEINKPKVMINTEHSHNLREDQAKRGKIRPARCPPLQNE